MVIINDINSAYFLQVFVFGTKPVFANILTNCLTQWNFSKMLCQHLKIFEKRKFKAGEINVILKLRDDPIFMAI